MVGHTCENIVIMNETVINMFNLLCLIFFNLFFIHLSLDTTYGIVSSANSTLPEPNSSF